jgi:hypothetical protein
MRKPQLKVVANTAAGNFPTPNEVRQWIEDGEPRAVLDALVTPEIAAVLLEYNRPGQSNRKMSERYLVSAKRTLEHSEWVNTGEPVIISNARWLNDGQHRLEAVVRSGIPAIMDLRFGVSRGAFGATNSGRKRSAGDALMMLETANHLQLASAIRMVLAYEEGLPRSLERTVTNAEIVDGFERWPEIGDGVTLGLSLGRGFKNAVVSALMFFALKTANRAAVEEFAAVMKSGDGRAENPPHRLREFLLRNVISQDKEKRARGLALGISAWNAWNAGQRRIDRLEWRTTQPFPTVDKLNL